MNTTNNTIILWGHFTVGEKNPILTPDDFSRVNRKNADLAIIVNDIDIARKLLFFSSGGSDIVVESISGHRCGDTCSRPSKDEVEKAVDWKFYQNAIDYIRELEDTDELTLKLINRHLGYLVDTATNDRLNEYGIDKSITVTPFKEKYLRNYAFRQLQNPQWKEQIESGGQMIVNPKGVPYCKGIMLSLFSILAKRNGYRHAIFYGTDHEVNVFNNSYALMQDIKKNYPDEKAWGLKLETRPYCFR